MSVCLVKSLFRVLSFNLWFINTIDITIEHHYDFTVPEALETWQN